MIDNVLSIFQVEYVILPGDNSDAFKLESFDDGSVKIVYDGLFSDDTVVSLIIQV